MHKVLKQSLIMPFKKTFLESGALNENYKKYWGYNHYGWDISGSVRYTEEDVYGSGIGKVYACGKDSRLGYVAVIIYDNVYNFKTKKVQDLVVRYYHMSKLYIKKGQEVSVATKIGRMSGYGIKPDSYGVHLHIDIDTDTKNPCYAGGVSGGTIIKHGSTNTMINPNEIMSLGVNQTFSKYANSWFLLADLSISKVIPTEFEKEDASKEQERQKFNGQKLIQPINKAKITAGYKNSKYKQKFKSTHHGHDMISSNGSTTIYASGNGEVLACGLDNVCGNVIAIKYCNCYNSNTKEYQDLVIRYFHLAKINVAKGDSVTKDTKIGVMGNTGLYTTGTHLHYEIDTDDRDKYACYTPSISKNSNILKTGTASTINPAFVIHTKTSAPDNQSIKYATDGYVSAEDKSYKEII